MLINYYISHVDKCYHGYGRNVLNIVVYVQVLAVDRSVSNALSMKAFYALGTAVYPNIYICI